MTQCKKIQLQFADAAEETPGDPQRENFYAHIRQCEECRTALHSYQSAMTALKTAPLFEPGMKSYDAVQEKRRGGQTVLRLRETRRASLTGWIYASAFCALALFFAYSGLFQKESKATDTQIAAFLMQHQATELTLTEEPVAFSGYDQILALENTKGSSWENVLAEFGL